MNELRENNKVQVTGKIISGFTYSHEVFGEKFYTVDLAAPRLSGTEDIIPLMVSERLMDVRQNCSGCTVEVTGKFQSYNRQEEAKRRLILFLFVKEIWYTEPVGGDQSNQIFLEGYICKESVYRKTPLNREIADLLLAVNRSYGRSDYIPCIAWGRNARYAAGFQVGTRIRIWGRIQSREYTKKLSETESEVRTAYEVSVSRLEVVDED